MYLLVKNTRSIQKKATSCMGEMLCLIFVPFYSLYWWYTRGIKVKQEFNKHGITSKGNGIVCLIFAIFGLSIVSMAIIQSDFNSLNEMKCEKCGKVLPTGYKYSLCEHCRNEKADANKKAGIGIGALIISMVVIFRKSIVAIFRIIFHKV